MNKFDVLVIGGGPAAITLVANIKDKMKVGIIRPEDHSMIYCAMPYAIEGLLSLEKTFKKDTLVTDAKAELIRDEVIKVNFNSKVLQTMKNGEIAYEKLVIATGASPIIPPVEGHNLNGVMTFKTEEDLKTIIKLVDNGLEKAVIVGAGAIGIELAQSFNARKVETHLVDMADHILPNMVDYELVEEAQESLVKSGIILHLKSKVKAIKGAERIENIVLDNQQIIHFDQLDSCSETNANSNSSLVLFAVGMKPNLEIFKDTNLKIGKDGIVINNKMETNIKDVFAIGDCCQFTSGITGEILSGKLATNAVPMGRVLANNLLGGKYRVYPGFFNGSATKINDYFIGGTGLTEKAANKFLDIEVGYAEFTTSFPIMPNAKKVKIKLIADKKTHKIVGGQFVSGEPVVDKVDKITMAIQYGITLEQLLEFSYAAQPYQSFFPAHNPIVKAAEEILDKIGERI